LLFHRSSGVSATAASTTIASAIAAVAVATAVAAAMAAITVVSTAAVAAVAIAAIAIAAIAATATTMTEGHRLVVTAQEGDTNDCEKDRKTKHNNTVHSQILQKYLQVPVSQKLPICRSRRSHRDNRRLSVAVRPKLHDQSHPSPEQFPVVKFYGLRKM
jgi:hypothetical protein